MYYDLETNKKYASVSLLKMFKDCPARTQAYLNGEYKQPTTEAMAVGSYVHAAFDGTQDDVLEAEKDLLLTKSGKPKQAVKDADVMIQTIKDDDFMMYHLDGQKEVEIYTEIEGLPFKCRIDNLNIDRGFISDIKTTRSLTHTYWDDGKVLWLEYFDYDMQLAAYRECVKQEYGIDVEAYIVAVTKEKLPDKAVIPLGDVYLSKGMERLRTLINEFKQGSDRRCDKCDYCKYTKVVSDYTTIGDLYEGVN